jgi:hypothetical protein
MIALTSNSSTVKILLKSEEIIEVVGVADMVNCPKGSSTFKGLKDSKVITPS